MLNISTGDFEYFKYFYYKKPFVFFGTLYLTLIPLYYNEVYNFFSSNLFITSAIAAAISLIVLMFAARKKEYRKNLILLILLWLISFFPQIMVHNEIRNLNMQLLVLYFILLIILFRLCNKNVILIITLLLIVINIFAAVRTADNSVVYQTLNVNEFSALNKIIGNNPDSNYVVLMSYHSGFNLPYEYYYYRNKTFGKSGIRGLPFYWRLENNPEYYLKNPHSFADISLNNDTLSVSSTNNNISIFGDIFSLNIIETQLNTFKGFKKIKMILPGEFKEKTKLFFDGKDWLIVQ
ncbi:MAG TPA: hypothetical protein PK447_04410 [Ignavibacteria bacterium]|nr:hypothetical protein [Ignavibacteria bacterium]